MPDKSSDIVLYGAPSSLYTAKARSALRARRIPYEERFPSHPRYREVIKPAVETHRVPVVEFGDGAIVQDSTIILDEIEKRHPDPVTATMGPRQGLAMRLVEFIADRGLAKPAMHYRWNFLPVNEGFVVGEFGRSLKFPATAEENERLGWKVASKMSSYLPMLGINARSVPAIEAAYEKTLALMNAHLSEHPYLLGGAPTRADYGMMGPMYGHLARDPYPLHLMQRTAPLVFRWTERINTGESVTPEFVDRPRALPEGDAVPETLIALIRHLLEGYTDEALHCAAKMDAHLDRFADAPAGTWLSPEGADQPILGPIVIDYYGTAVEQQAQSHLLWMLQRVTDWYDALDDADRAACADLIEAAGARQVMAVRLKRKLTRVRNHLAVA